MIAKVAKSQQNNELALSESFDLYSFEDKPSPWLLEAPYVYIILSKIQEAYLPNFVILTFI